MIRLLKLLQPHTAAGLLDLFSRFPGHREPEPPEDSRVTVLEAWELLGYDNEQASKTPGLDPELSQILLTAAGAAYRVATKMRETMP